MKNQCKTIGCPVITQSHSGYCRLCIAKRNGTKPKNYAKKEHWYKRVVDSQKHLISIEEHIRNLNCA